MDIRRYDIVQADLWKMFYTYFCQQNKKEKAYRFKRYWRTY